MGRFQELLRIGNFKGAFAEAIREKDTLKRIIMVSKIVERSYREEYVPQLLDDLKLLKSPLEVSIASSYVGRAFYALELEKEGERYFQLALEEAKRIPSPMEKAKALAIIGRNLVASGRYSDGLRVFRTAFDTLQSARALYSEVVSALVNLAKEIERSAEEIPNEIAIELYKLAEEIYTGIGFNLQAKEIEEKIKIAEEVFKKGSQVVNSLLETGNIDRVLQMTRFLPPAEKAVVMLNVSYWLFVHDYGDLAREVFNDALDILLVGKFPVKESEVEAIAYKFIRIGKLKEALVLAGMLKDEHRASELLGEIAITYARRGNTGGAMELASKIRDILIKDKVIKSIKELEKRRKLVEGSP